MYPGYRSSEYVRQEVMGASPIRLVVMGYDAAITACEQQDFEKAVRAVSILRDALNFDYAEVAVGLFNLYQWCLECIRKEDFTSARQTLQELRSAWATAEKGLVPAFVPVEAGYPVAASSAVYSG